MSTRRLDRPWVVGERIIIVKGSFVPLTGAGTVLATAVRGLGFGYAPVNGAYALRGTPGNNPVGLSTPGITLGTTGLYSITFEDPYLDCDFFDAVLAGPATGIATGGSALMAQPVATITNLGVANTAPTAQIVIVNNAGTPTQCVASCRCFFELHFRDTTVGFNKP